MQGFLFTSLESEQVGSSLGEKAGGLNKGGILNFNVVLNKGGSKKERNNFWDKWHRIDPAVSEVACR